MERRRNSFGNKKKIEEGFEDEKMRQLKILNDLIAKDEQKFDEGSG